MAQFATVFPVLPGKRDALKTLLTELAGPRYAEYDASSRRFGFAKDTQFVLTTPQGVLLIYYAEAPDIPKSFREWASSQDPFDLWFKQQMKDITGIDFNQPSDMPLPEQLHKYGFDDR
jgi:hypothetical protein